MFEDRNLEFYNQKNSDSCYMAPMISLDDSQTDLPDDRVEWTLDEELQRNTNLQKEDIDSLRDFCVFLPKVNPSAVTAELLVALLHVSDYNLDRAQNVATKYFDTRIGTPEVFADRHVENDDIRTALEVGYYCALPKRSPKGYRLILQALRQHDPSLFHYPSSSKVQFLTIDSCIHENPTCPGFVFLYDMNGVSMGHMIKWSLSLTRKIMKYLHEGIPLKIQQIHFVNSSPFTHRIMQILKPFINQQIWDMLKFHTADGLEDFWEYVPRECLPKEYGGYLPDLERLREDNIDWLKKMQPKVDNFDA